MAPWKDISPVMLVTGSAGGGKSRLCAEKVHGFCLRYPNSTGLILRKVRTSMANSTLIFLKRKVIGADPRVTHRPSEFRFEYENGSILAYGGMANDAQREHIRSIGLDGGVDIVWLEEAVQFDEQDYDEILARMRGKAAPWTQVMLSTNPDAPTHWIYTRLIIGKEASIHLSSAHDNLYNPDRYIERLSSLRGVQKLRLVDGKWVQAAGLVYDTWADLYDATGDHGGNVSDKAAFIPGDGKVLWWVDDGYSGKIDKKTKMFTGRSHPRVFLLVQQKGNGRFAVFAENYAIEKLAPQHIEEVIQMSNDNGWPLPSLVIYDRAAATLGGALKRAGLSCSFNTVPVEEGVKATMEAISQDENGFRRIIVSPSCKHLRAEMVSYSRDTRNGKIKKEFDHGPDCLRMGIWESLYGKGAHDVDVAAYTPEAIMRIKASLISTGDGDNRNNSGISIAVYGDPDEIFVDEVDEI